MRPLLKLLKNDQLLTFTTSAALLKPFYKLVYLAAARKVGLFDVLSGGPVRFEQLAETYCKNDRTQEALEAWLHLGIRLGYLELGARGYALKGLAKRLALPQNDAIVALLQEAAGLHYKLIAEAPDKLRNGDLFSLEDQDHLLPGREPGSRTAEPMGCCDRNVREAAEAGRNSQAVAGRRLQECENHSPDAWRGILCVQSDFSLNSMEVGSRVGCAIRSLSIPNRNSGALSASSL